MVGCGRRRRRRVAPVFFHVLQKHVSVVDVCCTWLEGGGGDALEGALDGVAVDVIDKNRVQPITAEFAFCPTIGGGDS